MNASEYNRILAGLRTSGPVLTNLSVIETKIIFDGRLAQPPKINLTLSTHGGDSCLLNAFYQCHVQDLSSDELLLLLSAQYALKLDSDIPLTEEFLKLYGERQVPLLTRPFLRELIHSVCGRFNVLVPGIPQEIVPSLPDLLERETQHKLLEP